MAALTQVYGDRNVDLRKEVERLRIQVELASSGVNADGGLVTDVPSLLAGFQTPEDFTIRENSLKYSTGDRYQGEVLGSLRHGRGVHTCANGDLYEGQWRYDQREGRGKMVFTSGLQYEGDWKEDKAHGHGMARYDDGSLYVGDWQQDHRWGWGTHQFPSGEQYEGEWWDDKITGRGRYTYTDGSYFEGEWRDGCRVKGKLVAPDNSSEYSGGWKDNVRHGYGVQYVRGLFKFMGAWQADQQHGEGKCIYADGTAYDGEWQGGMRHGKGKQSFGGYRYDGEWRHDKQHGSGSCQLDTGDRYVGEFQAGKRHGRGRCLYADGSKYDGEWADDVRCGRGTCVYANGDKYTGEWMSNRRHGQGVCKFADGTKFRGEWEDDGWVQSAADPAKCKVAGPGVTRAVAGQTGELLIEARDEQGNRRLNGGDEFQVHLRGPTSLAANVTDMGDGTYTVTYSTTVAGVYNLLITTGGAEEHVADSPYPLRVLPAVPCAKKCTVDGAGQLRASVGLASSCQVLVHDKFGNRWHGDTAQLLAQLPLEASLTRPTGAEHAVGLEPTRQGYFICTLQPTEAGYHRLHLSCHGVALPRTPISILAALTEASHEANTAGAVSEASHEAITAGAVPEDVEGSVEVEASNKASGVAGDMAAQAGCSQEPPQGEASTAEGCSSSTATHAAARKASGGREAVPDLMRVWERIAEAAYAADGSLEGWDSDSEHQRRQESGEDRYIKEHPGVPVVENLEDIWKVSRLQRERKAREERDKQARLATMRKELQAAYGAPGAPPTPAQVAAEVREIIQETEMADRHGMSAATGKDAGQAVVKEAVGVQARAAGTGGSGSAVRPKRPERLARLREVAAALDK